VSADPTPDTVDQLYERWVTKLKRERDTLRLMLMVALGIIAVLVTRLVPDEIPPAPKEGPK
jgi:hypothetical protein